MPKLITKYTFYLQLIILGGTQLYGQNLQNDWIPKTFQQYDQCSMLFNPASAFGEHKYEIISGYKMYTNFRKRSNEFHTGVLINPDYQSGVKDTFNHKTFGLFINSQNEAGIIHFNQLNGLYSYQLHINNDLKIALGTTVNLSNFVVDATPMDPGGSDVALSGNVGINIILKNTKLGISSGSIFNSNLQPTREQRTLLRHYYLHGQHTFNIDYKRDLELTGFLLPTRLRGSQIIAGTLYYVHNQNYYSGISYRHLESYLLVLGIKKLEFNNQSIRLSISYTIPSFKGFLRNSNVWEFQFGYLL